MNLKSVKDERTEAEVRELFGNDANKRANEYCEYEFRDFTGDPETAMRDARFMAYCAGYLEASKATHYAMSDHNSYVNAIASQFGLVAAMGIQELVLKEQSLKRFEVIEGGKI